MERSWSSILRVKVIPLYPLNKRIKEGWYSLPDLCTVLEMLRNIGLEEKVITEVRVIGDGGFLRHEQMVQDGMTFALMPTFAGG